MKNCCLVIPCYNESGRLNVHEYREFLKNNQVDLLFVNDGSSDKTWSMLEDLKNMNDHILIHNLVQNQGKAEAIRDGLNLLISQHEYKYIGYWDADLATPLPPVLEMIRILDSQSDLEMILGSRILKLGSDIKRKLLRHYLGRVFATAASILLMLPVYDSQCGAKLFRSKNIKPIISEKFSSKWLFDLEILFRYRNVLKRNDFAFELPLEKWADINGSKLKISDFLLAPLNLLKIYFRYKNGY